MKLVYWSGSGITERAAKTLGGVSINDYVSGECVLMFPSYGSPKTGGFIPPVVLRFLQQHHDQVKAVVGIGNLTFGEDFCLGAKQVAQKLQVPLLACIDIVPSAEEQQDILNFLEDK